MLMITLDRPADTDDTVTIIRINGWKALAEIDSSVWNPHEAVDDGW